MIRLQSHLPLGTNIFFGVNDVPHTGIIKEIVDKDLLIVKDITFLEYTLDECIEWTINKCMMMENIGVVLPKYPNNQTVDYMRNLIDSYRWSYGAPLDFDLEKVCRVLLKHPLTGV